MKKINQYWHKILDSGCFFCAQCSIVLDCVVVSFPSPSTSRWITDHLLPGCKYLKSATAYYTEFCEWALVTFCCWSVSLCLCCTLVAFESPQLTKGCRLRIDITLLVRCHGEDQHFSLCSWMAKGERKHRWAERLTWPDTPGFNEGTAGRTWSIAVAWMLLGKGAKDGRSNALWHKTKDSLEINQDEVYARKEIVLQSKWTISSLDRSMHRSDYNYSLLKGILNNVE